MSLQLKEKINATFFSGVISHSHLFHKNLNPVFSLLFLYGCFRSFWKKFPTSWRQNKELMSKIRSLVMSTWKLFLKKLNLVFSLLLWVEGKIARPALCVFIHDTVESDNRRSVEWKSLEKATCSNTKSNSSSGLRFQSWM